MRLRFASFIVIALSAPLAGCGGGMFGGGFDPTDMLNFLDNKKPLPGERKAVFPEGVPGVDRGVPPDMVRGSPGALAARQQVEQAQQPQLPSQPQEPPAQQAAVDPAPEEAAPRNIAPPPAQRPKGPPAKRRSVTAPPPEEPPPQQQVQQQQPAQPSPFPSPFPSPMQSGTFQKQ